MKHEHSHHHNHTLTSLNKAFITGIGVLVAGLIIRQTGWYVIDPIIGITVAIIILISTWNLLHDSIRLSLDGVPVGIDSERIKQSISALPHVKEIHHMHIWAISTTENALTAHIVTDSLDNMEETKHLIKHALEDENISHATLEFETETACCDGHCE